MAGLVSTVMSGLIAAGSVAFLNRFGFAPEYRGAAAVAAVATTVYTVGYAIFPERLKKLENEDLPRFGRGADLGLKELEKGIQLAAGTFGAAIVAQRLYPSVLEAVKKIDPQYGVPIAVGAAVVLRGLFTPFRSRNDAGLYKELRKLRKVLTEK